jgi:catechol 2,3-dioxygenase-like lactoylglutathione lyase family enzyme
MEMSQTRTGAQISAIRTIGISVSDQDRALDFYVGTLGFEKRLDATYGDGQRWVEVAPRGAATTIALVLPSVPERTAVETGIRFATDDADAAHEQLRARGVETEELLRWEGVPPMFSFRDPDGNRLVIVEQPPRS